MKMYPPKDKKLSIEELKKGLWLLYVDVKCAECGKEHALTNTNSSKCIKCGGRCS